MRSTNIAIAWGFCLALAAAEILGHLFPTAFHFRPRRYAYRPDAALGYACEAPAAISRPYAVVVGDSFSADPSTMPLEAMFPAQAGQRLGREILNLGCPGYGTLQEEIVAEREVPRLKPRWLVLELFPGNDWLNNYDLAHWRQRRRAVRYELYEKIVNDGFSSESWLFLPDAWLVGRSVVYTAAYNALASWYKEGEPSGAWHRDTVRAAAIGEEQADESLTRLREFCRLQGARFLVILVRTEPTLDQKENAAFLSIRAFLKKSRIPFIDPLDALRAAGKNGSALYISDGHWSPRAQAVIGELLARKIRSIAR